MSALVSSSFSVVYKPEAWEGVTRMGDVEITTGGDDKVAAIARPGRVCRSK